MCCLKLAIGGFLCEKSLLLSSDIQLIITQPIGDLKAFKVLSVFTFFLSPDQTSLLSPSLAPLSSHSTSLLYTVCNAQPSLSRRKQVWVRQQQQGPPHSSAVTHRLKTARGALVCTLNQLTGLFSTEQSTHCACLHPCSLADILVPLHLNIFAIRTVM